jgi:hypothetical protein
MRSATQPTAGSKHASRRSVAIIPVSRGSSRTIPAVQLRSFKTSTLPIPIEHPHKPGRPAPIPAGNSEMFEYSASRNVVSRTAASDVQVSRERQCYIPALIDNDLQSPCKINRKPGRLETPVSLRKQTTAPRINRKHFATSQIRFSALQTHRQNSLPASCYIRHARVLATSQSSRDRAFITCHASRSAAPRTTQPLAPICCAHESDIMISQSPPEVLAGNLRRITEWFN